jgi:hypothetical protein
MNLRCIDVEDMGIQTKGQAREMQRLKRLEDTVNAPEPNEH